MTTARKEDESFEAYKLRQKQDTLAVKELKKGVVFWDSQYQGTHINHEKQEQRKLKGNK